MELFFVNVRLPGTLAIATRPRGADWLIDDLKRAKGSGVGYVVSMLTPSEMEELDLTKEYMVASELSMEFLNVPVADRCLPEDLSSFTNSVTGVVLYLKAGGNVAVHCRMGIGRSSLFCAAVLKSLGFEVDEAWDMLRHARGSEVPDTAEQYQWLFTYSV